MTGLHLDANVGLIIARALSVLVINKNFRIEFVEPMPGRWHRFWYRWLLGWRWEEV